MYMLNSIVNLAFYHGLWGLTHVGVVAGHRMKRLNQGFCVCLCCRFTHVAILTPTGDLQVLLSNNNTGNI